MCGYKRKNKAVVFEEAVMTLYLHFHSHLETNTELLAYFHFFHFTSSASSRNIMYCRHTGTSSNEFE